MNADDCKKNLGGRVLSVPQGKMLGGSSGINGLSFTSSTKAVVDGWAELGNPGWEWSSFAKSMAKAYTVAKSPSTATNNEGPLRVAYAEDYTSGWPKVWAETFETLGFPGTRDTLNDDDQVAGALMIPDTVDPALGIRSYAANTYLPPEVRGRANLTIRTGVEVTKVLFNRESDDAKVVATGVDIVDLASPGATSTVLARREVILTSGVFHSPKILELSGIGDAERLGKESVAADIPGVGENLQNHPLITVSFEVESGDKAPPTKDAFIRAAIRQDEKVLGAAMMEYMQHRTGAFPSSGVTSAAQMPLPGLANEE